MRRTLSWALALSAGCLSACERGAPREAPTQSAPSPSSSAPTSACSDADCSHLDGECIRGACTAVGTACRVLPVNDGQPCGEGGLCGPARCELGTCQPVAAPECTEHDSECTEGYCDPALGCVARPKARPGSSCETALALNLAGGAAHERLNSMCGVPAPELEARGALGNAVYVALDLEHTQGALDISFLVGAGFPVEAVLLRGECDDRTVLAFGAPDTWHGDARGLRLRRVLEPGRYWLAVASVDATDRGPVEFAARVESSGDAPGTISLHPCGEPIPLRAENGLEVRLDPIVPATINSRCLAAQRTAHRCYRLDLTERSGSTLVGVQLEEADGRWVLAEDEVSTCAGRGEFGALLEPGVHDLHLFSWRGAPPELRVIIRDGADCASLANDSCDSAVAMDATLGTVTLRGNNACGAHYIELSPPFDRAKQVLYRLDLRPFSGPVRVRTSIGDTQFIAEPTADPTCGRFVAFCTGDCILAPREYLFGVEAYSDAFELNVDFSPLEPATPTPCIPIDVIACAKDSVFECNTHGMNHPRCVRVLEECGLNWEPLNTLCASHPECCDEGSGAAGAPSLGADCEQLFLDANARCESCQAPECWF